MRNSAVIIIVYVLAASAVLVATYVFVNRPELVEIEAALPQGFPDEGFEHDLFESLLREYVDSAGKVDYQRWHDSEDDRARLRQYLAAIVQFSPENASARFASRNDALAYWLYAYNAYVIHSVLEHWPLESVTSVKAPIEAVTGLGFFYRQRFLFGGEAYSLYAVEHEKILATYRDPRIHFVLNCASESCPVLKPELPTGPDLEPLLAAATAEFINDPRNVSVNHETQQVTLSTIFKWYKKDFLGELRRRGISTERGVIDYLATVSSDELQAELERATDYEVVYDDYDWALNGVSE